MKLSELEERIAELKAQGHGDKNVGQLDLLFRRVIPFNSITYDQRTGCIVFT